MHAAHRQLPLLLEDGERRPGDDEKALHGQKELTPAAIISTSQDDKQENDPSSQIRAGATCCEKSERAPAVVSGLNRKQSTPDL